LSVDWLLGQFSKDPGRACAAYRCFVAEGMQHPSIWEALRDQIYLGSEAFIEKVKREVDAEAYQKCRVCSADQAHCRSGNMSRVGQIGKRRWR
jgi:hypothetical protein